MDGRKSISDITAHTADIKDYLKKEHKGIDDKIRFTIFVVPVLGGTIFVENSHLVRPSTVFFFGFRVGPGTFST